MFALGFGGLGISAACALMLVLQTGFPRRFSDRVLAIDATKGEHKERNPFTQRVSLDDALDGRFPRLGATSPASVGIMVWGDSHARTILPAVDALASEHAVGVLTAWHSSTAPVLDYASSGQFSLGSQSAIFNKAVLDYISEKQIPVVVIAARWSNYFRSQKLSGNGESEDTFGKRLINTVLEIRKTGARIFILLEVPNHEISVPKALASRELFGTVITPYAGSRQRIMERDAPVNTLMSSLDEAGAEIIQVSDAMFDSRLGRYRMDNSGGALYYDNHHLSRHGALSIKHLFTPLVLGAREASPSLKN
jgi:hypothetical protein